MKLALLCDGVGLMVDEGGVGVKLGVKKIMEI